MHSLTLDQFKATASAGGVAGITLMAQGGGFFMEIATRAGGRALLAKARSTEPRRFGTPTSAMLVLRELGIGSAQVDFTRWDPGQKEVTQNRDRRSEAMKQAHEAAAHARWLASELQAAIDDPRPSLTTDQVLAPFESDEEGVERPRSRRRGGAA
jgi:hypothetical protein